MEFVCIALDAKLDPREVSEDFVQRQIPYIEKLLAKDSHLTTYKTMPMSATSPYAASKFKVQELPSVPNSKFSGAV